MPFKVEATPEFLKEAKKLTKKYPSLKMILQSMAVSFQKIPHKELHLARVIYKIRLAISSKGRGKSGGARVVTCVKIVSAVVYLVSICDKSVQSDISDKELKERISQLPGD